MLHLSLRSKTIFGTALIEGALLLLLIVVATRFFADTLNDNLQKRAETTSTLFATMTKDAVLSYDLASLDAFLDEVLRNPDIVYARVLDADGEVFAQKGDAQMLASTFTADTSIEQVNDSVYDSYALIQEGDEVYGRVQIGISIDQLQQSLAKITNWTLSIALTEMLLVGLFSWFLGSYLTGQLQKLKKATTGMQKSIETGDFSSSRLEIKGKDEVAQVAEAFNDLVLKLDSESQRTKRYQDELQTFNHKLEDLVHKRTEQLAIKNSELQTTFDDLQKAQQQLVQNEKMASMGQLAAGLAHEINNPVGFIKSNIGSLATYNQQFLVLYDLATKVVESKDADQRDAFIKDLKTLCLESPLMFAAEDSQELLQDIKDGLSRVIDIISNMTVFSRVDSDKKQPFNVNRCIETTVKMAKKNIEARGEVRLILAKLPEAMINVGKVNQVLTNLIVNAGQAIPENGKVIVKTALHRDDDNQDFIKITIADTGSGIAPEHLDKIFDPFFTTKAEGQGTGLGLSISFDIIKEHGGELKVSSKVGKGTVFTILLPVMSEQTTEEAA